MDDHADDLLRRALIDQDASAAVALRVGGLPLCEHAHGRLPRPPRPRHDPDLHHPRRPRGGQRGRRPTSCCASRATSTSPAARDREEAEELYAEQAGALRDALAGADTVLDSLARAARGPRAARASTVDRRIELDVRLPAHRLLPAALVAPEQADRRHRRLRRAAAGRGPAADGDRVRPAGRRPRLPAARRPGALPRGLPRAGRRARAPRRRAARPAGGLGRALPRALGRRLPPRAG